MCESFALRVTLEDGSVGHQDVSCEDHECNQQISSCSTYIIGILCQIKHFHVIVVLEKGFNDQSHCDLT